MLRCACQRIWCPKTSGAKKGQKSVFPQLLTECQSCCNGNGDLCVSELMAVEVRVKCLSPTLLPPPTGNLHLNRSLLKLYV